ncbi:histidine triad nucleotide-binding protein [Peptoniphilus asaccharolyticus]
MDCLFCKIISGEIPSDKIYEDDLIYAFNDIEPQAPQHFLVIPKQHITSLYEVGEEHKDLLGHIMLKISEIAKEKNLEGGYRVIANTREDGGQTVEHLHFHVLGGRSMKWPPG